MLIYVHLQLGTGEGQEKKKWEEEVFALSSKAVDLFCTALCLAQLSADDDSSRLVMLRAPNMQTFPKLCFLYFKLIKLKTTYRTDVLW